MKRKRQNWKVRVEVRTQYRSVHRPGRSGYSGAEKAFRDAERAGEIAPAELDIEITASVAGALPPCIADRRYDADDDDRVYMCHKDESRTWSLKDLPAASGEELIAAILKAMKHRKPKIETSGPDAVIQETRYERSLPYDT